MAEIVISRTRWQTQPRGQEHSRNNAVDFTIFFKKKEPIGGLILISGENQWSFRDFSHHPHETKIQKQAIIILDHHYFAINTTEMQSIKPYTSP
jgi:hypothetical protein